MPRSRAPILLLATLLAGCGSSAPRDPGPCPSLPCDLLADPAAWEVTGLAAAVQAGLPEPAERTDLLEDFEGAEAGTFGGGRGGVLAGEPGQRHLQLTTEERSSPWWRSPAVAASPDRSYALSWRQALSGVIPPKRVPKLKAGVAVEFLAVPRSVKDVDAWLAEPKNLARAKRKAPKAGAWRPAEGSSPWRDEGRTFRPPLGVTHLRVLVGGGPSRGGGVGSRVQLDDLAIRSTSAPAWAGRGVDAWQDPGAGPLQLRARGSHPAHRHADEIRDVVLAPAPSTLRRRLVVPVGARLDLGYGLVPGTPGPAVTFEAALVDAAGARHLLRSEALRGPFLAPWADASVDLTPWAGQAVTLELSTAGRPAPTDVADAVAQQPEARAAWTTARLEPASTPGRLAVLVIIDTLGAHHASGWEGKRETTPNLERIGREGVLYRQARAPAPWTLPTTGSYLTGLSPDVHGAGEQLGRDHWSRRPLPTVFDTLAERLGAAGWDTRAWINNTFLTAQVTRLDQGFHRYVDYGSRSDRGSSGPGMASVLKELERTAGDRFLLVHLMDPHLPYRPPLDYIERFVDPGYEGRLKNGRDYKAVQDLWRKKLRPGEAGRKHLLQLHEAAIAFADDQVGRVFDAARATGQELLFVVTSDHGEEFWEHGSFDHGHSLFDELLHVPLVAWRSGGTTGVVEEAVDATGVFGAVMDFAGLDRGAAPTLPAAPAGGPLHARPTLYGVRQRSVEVDDWKYIVRQEHTGRRHRRVHSDPVHLLYHLAGDPMEKADRMRADPARAHAMHRLVVGEALSGFPGAWFTWIGPGDDPVDLVWTMNGGGGWHPDVTDLPWPTEFGDRPEHPMTVERALTGDVSTVTLHVEHRPTLILLEPARAEGAVSVTLNGTAVPLPDARSSPAELGAMIDAGGGPTVGRLAGSGRRAGDDGPDEDDLEALRALGYMD
jgi:arylsulfatase A-like enzyme